MEKKFLRTGLLVFVLTLLALYTTEAAFTQSYYSITDLGPWEAVAVNNRGQVVGSSGGDAVLWEKGSITSLGPGVAKDINDAGQIVGDSIGFGGWYHGWWEGKEGSAWLWEEGTLTNLDMYTANAINNYGQIAGSAVFERMTPEGSANPPQYFEEHAVFWKDGAVASLDTIEIHTGMMTEAHVSRAYDINDQNQVVGMHGDWHIDEAASPFFWSEESGAINITAGNRYSTEVFNMYGAFGLNNRGEVVGTGNSSSRFVLSQDAFLWTEEDCVTYLATLYDHPGPSGNTGAYSINSSNEIVGWANTRTHDSFIAEYATIWVDDKGIQVLSDLIPQDSGWESLDIAYDINNFGHIVGQGLIGGETHAFLMTPQYVNLTTSQTYITDYLTLGDTFTFDYWWEMGIEPTEFNFDVLFFNGENWETFGWEFKFGGSSDQWETSTFWVPPWARGENTRIMFSLADWGKETDPTVYLRNIGSSSAPVPVPEPATIIFLGTGLLGLACASRKKFKTSG